MVSFPRNPEPPEIIIFIIDLLKQKMFNYNLQDHDPVKITIGHESVMFEPGYFFWQSQIVGILSKRMEGGDRLEKVK